MVTVQVCTNSRSSIHSQSGIVKGLNLHMLEICSVDMVLKTSLLTICSGTTWLNGCRRYQNRDLFGVIWFLYIFEYMYVLFSSVCCFIYDSRKLTTQAS